MCRLEHGRVGLLIQSIRDDFGVTTSSRRCHQIRRNQRKGHRSDQLRQKIQTTKATNATTATTTATTERKQQKQKRGFSGILGLRARVGVPKPSSVANLKEKKRGNNLPLT